MKHSKLLRAACVPAAVIFALIALSLVIAVLERDLARAVVREDGWVESATVACYGLAFLGCLYVTLRGDWPGGWSGSLVAAAAMARELDAHKRFTLHAISSIRYWRSDTVSDMQKGLVLAIVVLCVLLVVRTALPPLWRGLRAAEPHAVTLASIPVLLAVAQILDFLHFDDEPGALAQFFWAMEETFELGIPVCALVALLQWKLHVRRTLGDQTSGEIRTGGNGPSTGDRHSP